MNIYKHIKIDDSVIEKGQCDEMCNENNYYGSIHTLYDKVNTIDNGSCLFTGSIQNNNKESNGFTVYGDEIDTKFKTYHQLLYDGNTTNIRVMLKCKKTYYKL